MRLVALTVALLIAATLASDVRSADRSAAFTGVRITFVRQEQPPIGLIGDVEFSRWKLNDRHGRTVGLAVFDWRWVSNRQRLGIGELRLPLGTIIVAGTSQTRYIVYLAIVGGTGVYEGFHGVVRVRTTAITKAAVQIALLP